MALRGGRWLTVVLVVLLITSSTAMDRHAEHLIAQLRKRPACSALIVANMPGTSTSKLTQQLLRGVPGTKLVSAANPMEALETWLYNDVEFKAHPHVVIEQQGNVMHGFMDVIIPLMPGLKLMTGEKGCSLVTFTMIREPALNYITSFQATTEQAAQGPQLLEYARKSPEAQLTTLTRLADPLTHLKLHTLCDHWTDASCTVDAQALVTGLSHAVDFAINERFSVIDVVGIEEMFRQSVAALDVALGLNGVLVGLEAYAAQGQPAAPIVQCAGMDVASVASTFRSSIGYEISDEDMCWYNRVSLFEVMELRKIASASVRIYNRWRDAMLRRTIDRVQQPSEEILTPLAFTRDTAAAFGTRD